jgi:8-oxo-dGTP diphosphatase
MAPLVASAPRSRAAGRRAARASHTVDVVLLTAVEGRLAVLLMRAAGRSRERWALPWEQARVDEPLAAAAERLTLQQLGVVPAWVEQVGAFADGRRHPAELDLSVAFAALVPAGTAVPAEVDVAFHLVDDLPALAPRQRAMVDAAVELVRGRVGQAPVAFRLLPPTFTLSELQEMYELLLDRRLHKASFRRSLQAARVVEATDEWRTEGRGRPAQLFRYAPRKRRPAPRGVRFD